MQCGTTSLTGLACSIEAANVRQNDHYAGLLQVMDDYAVYVDSFKRVF